MDDPRSGPALEALIEREFPIRAHGVYANHAALGPWPRRVADAVSRFAAENAEQGPARYREWIEREQRLRAQLAALLKASSPADIALLKNTTEGISLVAAGLAWSPGDNIVLPADEFSSNRLPWLAQSAHGVAVREIDIRAAEDAEGALIAALDDRTRLLAASAVQWNDGFRLDLHRLGAACRERGVLFFVDAIQQLGALDIDVTGCGIDFLAADAHKWLLGPEGIAVFYSAAPSRMRLRLVQQGWHMFDHPWDFDRRDFTPSASARRFEAGSPNSLGQAALSAGLDLLHSVGIGVIEARVLENSRWLLGHLAAMPGLTVLSRAEPARRSGIVTVRPRDATAVRLHRVLRDLGIDCAVRGQAVRLSPHYYQGRDELERLAAGIERGLAGAVKD